ncbi:basic proline-rich protein-like [Sarcophilus harrisii]|uniref:basic proline-rich protein-like n=1 Tax=Sarcophilus harrisii TaxID=9305 RepID=UPI001301A369|nr:basic proline-rich protein-like [Sarcophilus harrisii]
MKVLSVAMPAGVCGGAACPIQQVGLEVPGWEAGAPPPRQLCGPGSRLPPLVLSPSGLCDAGWKPEGALGFLLSADMAEGVLPAAAWSPSPLPPGRSVPDLASEPGVTEQQPQPRTPPSSPAPEPGPGTDPDVPHPDLAPVVFFCLRQTTSPRNWCIKMVCNPYPLRLFPSWPLPINPPRLPLNR